MSSGLQLWLRNTGTRASSRGQTNEAKRFRCFVHFYASLASNSHTFCDFLSFFLSFFLIPVPERRGLPGTLLCCGEDGPARRCRWVTGWGLMAMLRPHRSHPAHLWLDHSPDVTLTNCRRSAGLRCLFLLSLRWKRTTNQSCFLGNKRTQSNLFH